MARARSTDRETPSRPARRSSGSMVAALFVLTLISVLVVFGIMLGKRDQVRKAAPEAATEPESASPFAGMTYTEEGLAKKDYQGGAGVADFESEAELWQRARDAFDEAEALIASASKLRADGNADWHDGWAEAKLKVEEALQRGDVWMQALIAERGEDSSEVKSLDRTLQKWRRTDVMLRKTSTR